MSEQLTHDECLAIVNGEWPGILLTTVEQIVSKREAAAEKRGAVKALRKAVIEMGDTDDPDAIFVLNGDIDLWLIARADRLEAGEPE